MQPPLPPGQDFFRTGEVSASLGVDATTLKNYVKACPELGPTAESGRRKLYPVDRVRRLWQLHQLIEMRQFSIEGARALLIQGDAAVVAALEGSTPPPSDLNEDTALRAALEASERARHTLESELTETKAALAEVNRKLRRAEAKLAVLTEAANFSVNKLRELAKKG